MYQGPVNQAPMMNWYPNQQPTMQNYPYQQSPVAPYSRPTIPTLPGKMVQRTEDIMPSDVPMDGSISLFPTADGSMIFAKSWNTDGTIKTIKYVVSNDIPEEPPVNPTDEILSRLTAIEKLLNRRNDQNDQKRKGGEQNDVH